MAPPVFADIRNDTSTSRIFIVGGGIVGSALAFYLSESHVDKQIVVLDKSQSSLLGSTGHAPGFVGQLNSSLTLTALAKDTVKEYLLIPNGFDSVGGLELATSEAGAEDLKKRCNRAKEAGLSAEFISPEKAAGLAPDFVKTETITSPYTSHLMGLRMQKAEARGAVFLETSITSLETKAGAITTISTSQGPLQVTSNPVILCTGIWTQSLLHKIVTDYPVPIVPVAHPYTFTPSRAPRSGPAYPFVRWPEHQVYARDYGDHDGFGSYNHIPSRVDTLHDSAVGTWLSNFESALDEACHTCLKNGDQFYTKRGSADDDKRRPYNGIFSMTPDNLPLAGKVGDVQNLWLCAAVWVTHAAGTAKLIARQFQKGGSEKEDDDTLLNALDPNRFKSGDLEILTREAVGKYNDIYNKRV